MYVPPDEPIQESGEVNMTLTTEARMVQQQPRMAAHNRHSLTQTEHSSTMGAAVGGVNPIYQRYVLGSAM